MPTECRLGRVANVSWGDVPMAVDGLSKTCFRVAEVSGRSRSFDLVDW